jgi:hypothetical protein
MCNFQSVHLPIGFILVMTILSACTDGKETKPLFSSFEFVKEREFLIHSLSTVELLDYHTETGMYLGYAHVQGGKEIVLVTADGQIELRRNMQGDGPDKYGATLSCLGFAENGDIWALTSVQLLRYNQKLELLERMPFKPINMVTLYYFTHKFQFVREDLNPNYIVFPVNPSGWSRNVFPGEEYNSAYLLEFYKQMNEESIEIEPISKRNLTNDFLNVSSGFTAPVYLIDSLNHKLILTTAFENQITVFDLDDWSVIGNIDVYHGDPDAVYPTYKVDPSRLPTNAEGWLKTPMNLKMHLLDRGMFALEYVREASIDPNPEKGPFSGNMHKDVFKNYIILFDLERQISADLKLPVRGSVMTSVPGNRLLVKVDNPESEEDFSRYHLYRIVAK